MLDMLREGGLEAQACSIALMLLAIALSWSDFAPSNLLTWLFFGGLTFLLVALVVLSISMEIHRRNVGKGRSLSV